MVSELDFLSEENIIRWSQALYGLICTIIDFKIWFRIWKVNDCIWICWWRTIDWNSYISSLITITSNAFQSESIFYLGFPIFLAFYHLPVFMVNQFCRKMVIFCSAVNSLFISCSPILCFIFNLFFFSIDVRPNDFSLKLTIKKISWFMDWIK